MADQLKPVIVWHDLYISDAIFCVLNSTVLHLQKSHAFQKQTNKWNILYFK